MLFCLIKCITDTVMLCELKYNNVSNVNVVCYENGEGKVL